MEEAEDRIICFINAQNKEKRDKLIAYLNCWNAPDIEQAKLSRSKLGAKEYMKAEASLTALLMCVIPVGSILKKIEVESKSQST
jgi:hypothetical protein